ncbi:2-dehydropantoate 2-reductase N-terminal domain-containing protein [Enterococcus hulanensis]|uniref:2-dehydropantoate 2-reductase N-terminal domain-containing protein n=1 Tax=Enterococcus hulanensis TaxID=2559929 RepID=A0ABU3EYP4_9ENTE|nr:2-dehydropantoate 2-reductase N-terminal domain-containing protein [Enterococcus hulanensis]MDT2599999.1 2-dehydropantoate 2-reductase N-terminal domain-containing protein [Enterococcus hulanensis]MDT2610073.1 2-dehydropantoate 2-reductase N-terminal domain-containing protein [Enterococcus hulanensis]MDT2617881.1 2-dehydropantoate 2-reductase N-terminal domain-containing protein [Enterococcus hulanensis]MDT2629851.1 2-dehydropantoate 2-reductase N-terminal domain-containing protein [Enteroco
MRILIYGAGIQGSYLAHSLMKGDNQVTLLARGKRKEELLSDGVVLYHRLQRKLTKDNIRVIEKLQPEDKYDLIFVTMKYSDFPAIIEPLAKNCSQTILFIGNQLNAAGLEKELQKRSAQQKAIYFGFQMTGGIKTDKGISILRFGKGQLKVGSLTADFKITNMLDTAFNGTNYVWRHEAKMDDWLKSHATMIMVQNSFEYLYDFSAEAIRRSGELSTLPQALKEGTERLEASGHEILPKGQNFLFQHPALSKLFYTLYYRLPISQMVQGDFKEVQQLIIDFEQYQTKASPKLDSMLQAARKKYEKSQGLSSSAS